jgi:hypothetical protein
MVLKLLLSVVVLALPLTLIFASDLFRRFVGWSFVSGALLGVWVIAPEAMRVHHLYPSVMLQWMWFLALMLLMWAMLGAVGAAVLLAPFAAACWRLKPRAPRLAVAFISLAAVPCIYFALSLVIESLKFGRVVSADITQRPMQIAIGASIAAIVGMFVLYQRLASRPAWCDGRRARIAAVGALVLGCVALPIRVPAVDRILETQAPTLVRRSNVSPAPLLVIGLDGGNWATLRPVLESGRAPTLDRILRTGQYGEIEALWPPYWSGPAWAAVVTGHGPEITGVSEDLAATAPGLPSFELPLELNVRLNPLFAIELALLQNGIMQGIPMPRAQLKRAPVWERVADAGGQVAVVRFPFTYPATRADMTVVSNIVSNDLWGFLSGRGIDSSRLVSPASVAAPVLDRFAAAADGDSPALRTIFPPYTWPHPANTPEHPIPVLGRVFDVNEKTFDAAEFILARQPNFDLFMLHVSSLDNIYHAFWKFRFPQQFPERIDPSDIQALGGVVDRYIEYLDGRIQRIVALMPREPNVIVVADHGHEASLNHALWSGWHGQFGSFAAAGPDIPRRSDPLKVSYFSIAPLILELLGFARPADFVDAPHAISLQRQ